MTPFISLNQAGYRPDNWVGRVKGSEISRGLFAVALVFTVNLSPLAWAQSADTDGDGMPDAWESSHGLNSSNGDDALTDLDGDRVPNLWEYARGTSPTDPLSKPTWDATVDNSLLASNSALKQFKTFQEAYDSVLGGTYRSLIRVKAGYYHGGWDGSDIPKKTAWLGDPGVDAATIEAPVEVMAINSTDELVLDGIEVTRGDATYSNPSSEVLCVVRRHATLGTYQPRVRLVNCIVRRGNHFDLTSGPAGGLLIENCRVVLDQCTFWNNEGVQAKSIRCNSGTLTLSRSIISGDWPTSRAIGVGEITAGANTTITGTDSLVSGTTVYGLNVPLESFKLTQLGYPVTHPVQSGPNSNQALNIISNSPVPLDMLGQSRINPGFGDLGAVEWVDNDNDGLPNLWEEYFFGDLNITDYGVPHGDPDGDYDDNAVEYTEGTNPIVYFNDIDRDGMDDSWEVLYFGSYAQGFPQQDPDGDGYTNLQESLAESNPLIHWNDSDFDGLWDNEELIYFVIWDAATMTFLPTLSQSYLDDYDNDGYSNGLEMNVMGTDPTVSGMWEFAQWMGSQLGFELGSDPDWDGLTWEEEVQWGTNPFSVDSDGDGIPDKVDPFPTQAEQEPSAVISVQGPPQITLLNPPGAVLIN